MGHGAFYVAVTALDVLGLVLILLSIKLAGSGLFQVFYSSVVGWAAILAWAALGKTIAAVRSIYYVRAL